MHDENMNNQQENIDGIKIVPDRERKSPINKILIGLILILAVLLALQISNMNNVEDVILEPEIPEMTTPQIVELTPALFDADTIILGFADVKMSLQTQSIRDYYEELTNNMDNFTEFTEYTIVPSENIFEMKFMETQTCIYFYDRISGDQSFITIMHQGKVIGTYLIPATYYGNLYNIVYTADELTEKTKEVISKQVPDIAAEYAKVAVMLNEQHQVTENEKKISIFDAKIKNKETSSIVYSLNDEKILMVHYMNLRYYVYLTELDGTIIQEGVFNHYSLLENGTIRFYNEQDPISDENLFFDETGLFMRVS